MCREWLEDIERGFFQRYNRHLKNLEREILLRCYETNQRYEDIATELGYTTGSISGQAFQLWKLLSDVFGEDVKKKNLQGAVERFVKRDRRNPPTLPPSTLEPQVNFRIFISDRSQNPEPNLTEQLREALQEAGQVAFVGKNWWQRDNEELYEYDGFLLLVSSYSASESNIVIKEVQKAKQLRDARPDNKSAILLVHVNSLMSLPLNHPLHQELQGISQLEWHSSTELPALVGEIIKCLKIRDEWQALDGLESLIQNLSRLEISKNWLLTYIGENQLHKLSDLVCDLRNLNKRKIQSGYSYWGVGPTRMWERACSDPAYHMRENLQQFPRYARQFAQYVNKEHYNFVSLGVGEGSKDSNIIADFFNKDDDLRPRDDFLYLPVDMSLDMLRIAISRIQGLPLPRRIAIQRDIETKDGMAEIAQIAQVVGQQKPILYGFIGNTIANVEEPEQVLSNIVRVMRDEDLLLFEAQIVDASYLEENWLQTTMRSVREEYEGVSFRQFALSALLQNSDLSVEPIERDSCYLVNVYLQPWKYGQVLQIDCLFENNTDRQLYLTFANEDTTTLNLKEKIRLYRSRKFTQSTLKNLVRAMNLSILGTNTYLSDKGTGFMVMMLKRQN